MNNFKVCPKVTFSQYEKELSNKKNVIKEHIGLETSKPSSECDMNKFNIINNEEINKSLQLLKSFEIYWKMNKTKNVNMYISEIYLNKSNNRHLCISKDLKWKVLVNFSKEKIIYQTNRTVTK